MANGTGVVRVVLDRQAGPVQRSGNGNGNTVVARDQHRDQAGRLGIVDHDEHVHATDRTCGTEGRTKRHLANPGGVTPRAL